MAKDKVYSDMETRPVSEPKIYSRLAVLSFVAAFELAACGGGVGASGSPSASPSGSNPPPAPGPSAPTLSLSASPTVINKNGGTTLSWSSSNATSCSASGGWSGAKALSGSQSISALANTATFSLDCTGTGGAVSRSVTVTVSASFVVDTAWAPNADNPDGYLVYVGPTAATATTLVKTLAKGATDWNPASPSAQLAAADVQTALGTVTQVCVAIRAFNGGGMSLPSQATCAALP